MANIQRPADGLNEMCNGRLRPWLIKQLGFSDQGCAYRGTVYCLRCPWARTVPVECEYKCAKCLCRFACCCGHSSQTVRVEAWFRIGEFAEVKTMDDQNVGQLRRFEVRGHVYLRWYCDCPDCHSSHGKTFRIERAVLDREPEGAVAQAIQALGYEYDHIEWQDGPEVLELALGEDERMRLAGAPELLTA